ncbi:hypothetical protein, partial [Streptomyces beijiangensis]
MSLSVDVFLREGDGFELLDMPPGCNDQAGFESWRTTVWGSDAVRSLGARFFPRLDRHDVEVEPDEVAAFLEECALIRANLPLIAASTAGEKTLAEHGHVLGRDLDNIVG